MTQVISNVVQIAFFITPVMWQPSALSHSTTLLIDLNPFANHLLLISGPLLAAFRMRISIIIVAD